MKRFLCLLLVTILSSLVLSGCSDKQNNQNDQEQQNDHVSFSPESTAVPNSSVLEAANAFSNTEISDQPTLEPVETISSNDNENDETIDDQIFSTHNVDTNTDQHAAPSGVDTSAYQFSSLSDHSLGFTFNYPSHWQNIPGIYTVCFQEQVEDGDVPARVAITRKKLTHTPDASDLSDHLIAYLKTIYKQYDTSTFEVSGLNTSISFMGQNGYSTTYLAFKGETEVEGFVILCVVERTLYVYHFSASYSDYQSMESMMQYMCKSVQLVDE